MTRVLEIYKFYYELIELIVPIFEQNCNPHFVSFILWGKKLPVQIKSGTDHQGTQWSDVTCNDIYLEIKNRHLLLQLGFSMVF